MNAAFPVITRFHPTTTTLDPPPDDDPLGAALVKALNRDLSLRITLNLPAVLILGLATAGLAPLVVLLLRFRTFAIAEKFQFENVNEWVLPSEQQWATAQVSRAPLILVQLGLLLAGLAVIAAAVQVALLPKSFVGLWTLNGLMYKPAVVLPYLLALVAAQLFHWEAVRWQDVAVGGFVAAFNVAVERRGLPPVVHQEHGKYGYWSWLGIGTVLLLVACVWSVPMMLAAGAHRRYTKQISRDVRAQIAQRIEAMMRQQRQPHTAASVG